MWKIAKYVCLGLLFLMTIYQLILFTWSSIAERKAEQIAEIVATLKPGYTTEDNARILFKAHGLDVRTVNNACDNSRGPCDLLGLRAASFPPLFPFHLGQIGWITVLPLPPVKTAYFLVDLYFKNGLLDSFNEIFHVGATGVSFSRDIRQPAGTVFRSSEWRYGNGEMVGGIGAIYSGNMSDVPTPTFAFNYMYSLKCVDARTLWPSAPSPTIELHGWPGCR